MELNGKTKDVLIQSNSELSNKLKNELSNSHADGIVHFPGLAEEIFLHRLCTERIIYKQELIQAIASITSTINPSRIYIDISNNIFLFPDTLYDLFGPKGSHYWLATPHSLCPTKDFYLRPPYIPKELLCNYTLTPLRLTRNTENPNEAHFNTNITNQYGSPIIDAKDSNQVGAQGILYIA